MIETLLGQLPRPLPRFVIYTLHYSKRVGAMQHYVGITRTDQVERRMREHAAGTGCVTTARAVKAGATLHLVSLIATDQPSLEKRLKKAGHHDRRCAICTRRDQGGGPEGSPCLMLKSLQLPQWTATAWRSGSHSF